MKYAKACLFFLLMTNSCFCATPYNNIIIFGDSLSDSASLSEQDSTCYGNNYWLKTTGRVGAPVTSVNPRTQQRTMWPNYFVQHYFSDKHMHVIYPSSQINKYALNPTLDNINYAWGSAQSGAHYINDAAGSFYPHINDKVCLELGPGLVDPKNSCVPGVYLQVQQYLKDVDNRPSESTLFIIWAGGNDLFNNIYRIAFYNKKSNHLLLLYKFLDAANPDSDHGDGLSNAPQNIKKDIMLLLNNGVSVDHIYVLDLPNIADIPAALNMTKGNRIAMWDLRYISYLYSRALEKQVRAILPSGHLISIKELLSSIEDQPQMYGITHTVQSCTAQDKTPYCKGFIFFNGKHPSSFAHEKIAAYIDYEVIRQREK